MKVRVLSWNINSVRLRIDSLLSIIKEYRPNVVCIQETKCPNDQYPYEEFHKVGLKNVHSNGIKGYHGVSIATDLDVKKVEQKNFCGKRDGRHLALTLNTNNKPITIHNFYVPAGGDEPDPKINDKFKHKLDFLNEATDWFSSRKNRKDLLLLVGDLNIAPHENDVWSHKQLLKIVSHTPIEIKGLNKLQSSYDFIDSIREFHPYEDKLYSWWSYRSKNWEESNRGRRLDHIWASPELNKFIKSASVEKKIRGYDRPSDHVPLIADFEF